MDPPKPQVAFISGPLDPSPTYFSTHYIPPLTLAISLSHTFLIGPVRGVDALALHYLLSQNVAPSRITIYMASFEYASVAWRSSFTELGVNVHCEVGAVTTRERDAAMTRDSDYDILRYRTEGEAREMYGRGWWPRVSNTEMNERRRRGVSSQAYCLEGEGKEGGGKGDREAEADGGEAKKSRLGKLFGRW